MVNVVTGSEQRQATFEPFVDSLTTQLSDRLRRNEPLSGHTTARLGGPADLWLPVTSLAELVEVVSLARRHQVPFLILGGGANLLISDAGIRGLVLENRADQVQFPPHESGADQVTILVESGVVLPSLARRCARRGLSGLEWVVGVPGTAGGAIANNAGAYGSDMANTLVQAELLSPAGERVWQPVSWFNYSYRTSRLKAQKQGWVVLQAELRLSVAQPGEVEARMNRFNEQRKSSQPPGATMGSMFKNPPGDYAGRLIEAAGLKGYEVGQAQISPVHANFFKNLGKATATEMMALIKLAQTTVATRFGVTLELEIEVLGEFPEET
jgi:UDP-N-acetylmuramate dehydrogenase